MAQDVDPPPSYSIPPSNMACVLQKAFDTVDHHIMLKTLEHGVPKGSIVASLLFLTYINYLHPTVK